MSDYPGRSPIHIRKLNQVNWDEIVGVIAGGEIVDEHAPRTYLYIQTGSSMIHWTSFIVGSLEEQIFTEAVLKANDIRKLHRGQRIQLLKTPEPTKPISIVLDPIEDWI